MSDWFEWATDAGQVVLSDGRRIEVRLGDMLLASFDAVGCISFHDITRRVLH